MYWQALLRKSTATWRTNVVVVKGEPEWLISTCLLKDHYVLETFSFTNLPYVLAVENLMSVLKLHFLLME